MKIAGVDVPMQRPVGVQTPVDERPLLFHPITLRGVTARNRIMTPPMSQYLSVMGKGIPTDWQLVHLGQFAIGGAGIVFCEETAVEARGRRTHNCAGIYTNEQVRSWRRITDFLKDLGAVPGIQLGHAGRRSAIRGPLEGRAPLDSSDALAGREPWQTISSSATPDPSGKTSPVALDLDGIKTVIAAYRDATLRSLDAGFDAIEIHGAHGYLIFQFLSPLFNKRIDSYGGDLQGRMRFALEVCETVRAVWPADRPLFFRISAVDNAGGHWDIDDTVAFAHEIKARGVDVVDCSSGSGGGWAENVPVPKVPGYHVPYAEHVRREVGITSVTTGEITMPEHAETLLRDGKCDIIGVARGMLHNPYWAAHAAEALGLRDWVNVLPPMYSARLERRESDRRKWPRDGVHEIPFRRNDNLQYKAGTIARLSP